MPPSEDDQVNYLDTIAADIQRAADPDAPPFDGDRVLYRLYAVLLLAKGQDVTAEDVHNAWVAWASERTPLHRSIKPFAALSPAVQALDQPYVNAIHAVSARQLGVGNSPDRVPPMPEEVG